MNTDKKVILKTLLCTLVTSAMATACATQKQSAEEYERQRQQAIIEHEILSKQIDIDLQHTMETLDSLSKVQHALFKSDLSYGEQLARHEELYQERMNIGRTHGARLKRDMRKLDSLAAIIRYHPPRTR